MYFPYLYHIFDAAKIFCIPNIASKVCLDFVPVYGSKRLVQEMYSDYPVHKSPTFWLTVSFPQGNELLAEDL